MRKLLALSIMLVSLIGLQAQPTIANSNFEQWSNGKLVNWSTDINGILTGNMTIDVEVHFGEQTSDAHSGSSAVRIASADVTSTTISYTMNLPGFLQAGESNGFTMPLDEAMDIFNTLQDSAGIATILSNLDSLDLDALAPYFEIFSKGVPCDSTPQSITAWVKYIPQEGDMMGLFVMTKKNGELVDYNFQLYESSDPTQYEQIGIDFNTPGALCDSILVIFVSATQMNSSSVLYVDDVKLIFRGMDIDSYSDFPGKVYPNPATDQLYIHPYNDLSYVWTLTDMTGKTLMAGEAIGETCIGTGKCAPGMYLLHINGDGTSYTRKIVIQ